MVSGGIGGDGHTAQGRREVGKVGDLGGGAVDAQVDVSAEVGSR
jgi:hypothetical protein